MDNGSHTDLPCVVVCCRLVYSTLTDDQQASQPVNEFHWSWTKPTLEVATNFRFDYNGGSEQNETTVYELSKVCWKKKHSPPTRPVTWLTRWVSYSPVWVQILMHARRRRNQFFGRDAMFLLFQHEAVTSYVWASQLLFWKLYFPL